MPRSAAPLALSLILLAACRDATGVVEAEADLAFVHSSPYDTLHVANPETGEIVQRIPLSMPGYGVRLSPKGDRVVIRDSQMRIWVMGLDGSDARHVAMGGGARWSPDGTRLAYIGSPGPELRIVNADGSADVVVPGAIPGGYGGIDWAPDGRRIAFEGMRGGHRTIYVVNTDGSQLRDIDLTLPGPESRATGSPTWSPDGRKLAFSRHVAYDLTRHETRLWVATLATRDARSITTVTGSTTDVRPDWSPDGSQIAFLRFEGDKSDVFVVRPDGSGLRRITDTPTLREESPQWLRR